MENVIKIEIGVQHLMNFAGNINIIPELKRGWFASGIYFFFAS